MKLSDSQITALSDYFLSRQDAIVSFARALVETESPSGDEAGSQAVVSLLAAAAAGISRVTTSERVASENYGEHLRLTAFGDSRERPIIVLGHTDTVHPRSSLKQRPWRVEGNRAYGPGVFDMKANCALALEAIRACVATGLAPQRPVVLLLTCDEETGSRTGRQLVEAEARRAHAVLVLKPPAVVVGSRLVEKERESLRLKRAAAPPMPDWNLRRELARSWNWRGKQTGCTG